MLSVFIHVSGFLVQSDCLASVKSKVTLKVIVNLTIISTATWYSYLHSRVEMAGNFQDSDEFMETGRKSLGFGFFGEAIQVSINLYSNKYNAEIPITFCYSI